jgi:hypothetical protein
MELSNRWVAVSSLAWAAALGTGFTYLAQYKSTAAPVAEGIPARWPAASEVVRNTDGPTLVLFAHPRCPCTHATVSEMARLLARLPGRVATHVVVVAPAGVPADWTDTGLWDRAAAIPGVQIRRDAGGREAARFRATASGQVLLYDQAGDLRFQGGITASRGHEGDSLGRQRLLAVLQGQTPDRRDSPVFGCGLGTTAVPPEAEEHVHEDDAVGRRG